MSPNDQAIVVFTIGKKYYEEFNKTFRSSIERFAKKIGRELIIVEDYIFPSTKHPSWQKLVMFSHPKIAKYDKVLMVDADIFITNHAKDIFSVVGDRPWAAAKNNAYDIPRLKISDVTLYKNCPPDNRPEFVVNCGMFMVSKSYQADMERIFQEYDEQICYEQGPFSYFLLNDKKGIVLSSEFNTIAHSYIEKYGKSLFSILSMYEQASFIHYTASKHKSVFYFLKWFDQVQSVYTKKIVYFFGNKRFDLVTRVVFDFWESCIGIYNYRIKRLFQ